MISVEGLRARAGSFELSVDSLEVAAGELLVLLGPSGAGKTVLLESLIGLTPMVSGRVRIGERDVTDLPPEARGVAYLPQDLALFPHLSVRENILFGRRVRGDLEGVDDDLVRIARRLSIEPLLERESVQKLSGGERQRVALARAMIINPTVLFLDESFSSLDEYIRTRLLLQLRELQQELGMTMVYVTHNQAEARILADRAAVIMDGRQIQVAPTGSLFARPADLRVARFLQVENLHRIEATEVGCYHLGGQRLEVTGPPVSSTNCWLGIAVRDLVLLRPGAALPHGISTNVLPGRMSTRGRADRSTQVRVELEGAPGIAFDCEFGSGERLLFGGRPETGDEVELYLPPEALAVFPERRTTHRGNQ